jgi:hypothetical protein
VNKLINLKLLDAFLDLSSRRKESLSLNYYVTDQLISEREIKGENLLNWYLDEQYLSVKLITNQVPELLLIPSSKIVSIDSKVAIQDKNEIEDIQALNYSKTIDVQLIEQLLLAKRPIKFKFRNQDHEQIFDPRTFKCWSCDEQQLAIVLITGDVFRLSLKDISFAGPSSEPQPSA